MSHVTDQSHAGINNIKEKIKKMMQACRKKLLDDGSVSKVTIVPFTIGTDFIRETIGHLSQLFLMKSL